MKKYVKVGVTIAAVFIILSCIVIAVMINLILGLFSSDANNNNQDNPLKGKDTNERIIMSLERTYPDNEFTIVKEYGKHNGKYYAVCADENGLEFKVDRMIYDNTYHFGCYDEYLVEVLKAQDFIKKVNDIADAYGYKVNYDNANETISVVICLSDNINITDVATMMKKILNVVDTPKMNVVNGTFSTGEVNYYTSPGMNTVFYEFTSKDGVPMQIGDIDFDEKEKSVEEMSKDIQTVLDEAKKNLEAQNKK